MIYMIEVLTKQVIMSKTIELMALKPERIFPGGRMTEHLVSNDHKCKYCQGNGYLWQENELQERYKEECPICKGSGKLSADITIEWKASK